MKFILKNAENVFVRRYREEDFRQIQEMNSAEGWSNLVEKNEDTKEAWNNSTVAFSVENADGDVIACVRGLTDTRITLYIAELMVDKKYRGLGIGKKLLRFVHDQYPSTRMEMLATSSSQTYYKEQGYRPFYGYRKTYEEQL
ncbi:GNAT family N-acetyltransferase [Virgibacillus kekensis]|uniref:GNAT family N-acetyltransferase n=1 Tax=Virgibacillus kekensis TaxID=202261 RepID=A0ABV9DNY1_9BACI